MNRLHAVRWAGGLIFAVALTVGAPSGASAQSAADQALLERVEAAIRSASDLPADSIEVSVSDGVVTLRGALVCDGCGAGATPGGTATLEQNLGAVVRAVPGVEKVEFELEYGRR